MVNIVRFSIFQYLPNDMRACPFIHVWKYCHDVRNMDVNDAISPASPEASNQDFATVFRAIVLEEALHSWAHWLPVVALILAPQRDW
jgi:hypothetical protein